MGDEVSCSLEGKALSNLRVVDLKHELEKRGLSKSGSKKELIRRLKQKLELEKLFEESAATGAAESKLQLDAATVQNEFVRKYLAEQQKIYAQQKEVRRLIEHEEQQKSTGEEDNEDDEESGTDSEIKDSNNDTRDSADVSQSSCNTSFPVAISDKEEISQHSLGEDLPIPVSNEVQPGDSIGQKNDDDREDGECEESSSDDEEMEDDTSEKSECANISRDTCENSPPKNIYSGKNVTIVSPEKHVDSYGRIETHPGDKKDRQNVVKRAEDDISIDSTVENAISSRLGFANVLQNNCDSSTNNNMDTCESQPKSGRTVLSDFGVESLESLRRNSVNHEPVEASDKMSITEEEEEKMTTADSSVVENCMKSATLAEPVKKNDASETSNEEVKRKTPRKFRRDNFDPQKQEKLLESSSKSLEISTITKASVKKKRLDILKKSPTPDTSENSTPEPFKKSPTPESSKKSSSPEPLKKSSSPDSLKKSPIPEHSARKREAPEPAVETPPVKVTYRKLNIPFKRNEEKSEQDDKEKSVEKKRLWGNFSSVLPKTSLNISSDSLKSIIPDFKVVCSPQGLTDDEPPLKTSTRSNLALSLSSSSSFSCSFFQELAQQEQMTVDEGEVKTPTKIELVEEEEATEESMSGTEQVIKRTVVSSKQENSRIIFIQNLVRPFTLNQLKQVLRQTGTLVEEDFWIDKIKSKCFVTYETEDQASETREALNNSRWPASNPKILSVDFATREELEYHKNLSEHSKPMVMPPLPTKEKLDATPVDSRRRIREKEERSKEKQTITYMREWDKDKVTLESPERERPQSSKDADKYRTSERRRERKEEKRPEEDTPAKLLDDLFHKTKATPCIYWLPLTEEQVKEREEQRKQRRMEREKRHQQEEAERRARRKPRERGSRSRSHSPGRRR